MLAEDRPFVSKLDAAEAEAIGLVDRLAWCNFVERTDNQFGFQASAAIRDAATRDVIKQIVAKLCHRWRGDSWAMRVMEAWPDLLAQEIVTSAVKAWLVSQGAGNDWLLNVRLICKFEGIDAPFVQVRKLTLEAIAKGN